MIEHLSAEQVSQCMIGQRPLEPVSYTHLDVYKRQALDEPVLVNLGAQTYQIDPEK